MKTVCVVVATAEPARVAEALRAAVGLGLRGDRVAVCWRVAAPAPPHPPAIARCLATLRALGHDTAAPPAAIEGADAVEVWS